MRTNNYNVAVLTVFVSGCIGLAAAQETNVADHMQHHNDAMIAIQRSIIAGSLDGVREPARWLQEHDKPAGLTAADEDFIDSVRAAAGAVLEADSLEAAAEAASQMGLACGNCHLASGVTVEFDEVDRPSDKETEKPHMQRHQWAADRMWEGLIGPSQTSWHRGSDLLFESPVKPDVLARHGGGDEAIGMSRRIHQLSANATVTSDPGERAEIFAEFIANCGSCHVELGARVGR